MPVLQSPFGALEAASGWPNTRSADLLSMLRKPRTRLFPASAT